MAVVTGYAVGVALAAVAAREVPAAVLPGPGALPVVLGVAVRAGGLVLRIWAVRTLGADFTYDVRVRPGQPVVRTGPYRLMRHPSYSGALLATLGLGLALGTWLSLALAVLVPLPAVLRRIAVEERALTGELGWAYEDYRSSTRRLVPWIW